MDEIALLGIVLLPIIGALVCGVFGRIGGGLSRSAVHGIACSSVAGSFVLALYCFSKLFGMHEGPEGANPVLSYTAYEWFSLSLRGEAVPVNVRFAMDALSGVMTLVVTGIGLLIHIYSTGYMSEEPSYGRFFAYLNLFTASMLILVLGANLPLLFVGWEGVGLCSYLLIGFWYENPAYAAAGRKAFVANRIGDFGVIIGMFLLMAAAGSFEFIDINAAASKMTGDITLPGLTLPGVSVATVATLFLFLGCAGKSAQIPLYVWLPDAMAGPTPVSALIHAATMVTSGLYLICRLSPVFALAPASMMVIAVIGTVTALVAATIGCVQNDIKKVLAYSTVSQLGFMFAAAGCGAFAASFFHVFTHAFFKACMFLGAGSVMHAVGAHGDADIRLLGGLKKWMPKTRTTFLVSCLAIAGVPGFSGFFSKDEVLVGALSVGNYFPIAGVGYAVFGGLVIAATMTAFYMFRLYFLTFEGEYRGGPKHDDDHGHRDEHAHHDPHESPASMTIPLIVLGIGAVFAGYFWIGIVHYEPWVHWLEPALGSIGVEHHGAVIALIGGSLAALIGIGLAYSWYSKGVGHEAPAKLQAAFPRLHQFVFDKWRVDEFYEATILGWSRLLGMALAGVDKVIVDGVLANLSARAVSGISFALNRAQNGLVHTYSAVMAAGALAVVLWFAIPQVEIELPEQPKGMEVELKAAKGLGYEYQWDFNADGTPDTEWSADSAASHEYASTEFQPGLVAVIEPAGYDAKLRNLRVDEGESVHMSEHDMGLTWRRDPAVFSPPLIIASAEGLVVEPRGAMVRFERKQVAADEKITVARGQHIDIGQARITVVGEATPTLRVRNAFGVERECQESILLPQVSARGDLGSVELSMRSRDEVGGVRDQGVAP
jgi:NADH-quinone oxidoreductase subunit L